MLAVLLLFLYFWSCAWASISSLIEDGRDLMSFVSRPDLRPPRLTVARHKVEDITPGYWFVAPYSNLETQFKSSRIEFTPYQTGPHIYDENGMLVWSGARKYGNRNVFGFKPVRVNDTQFLTFHVAGEILHQSKENAETRPAVVVMNNNFEEVQRVYLDGSKDLDIHEFKVLPDTNTALVSTAWRVDVDAHEIGQTQRKLVISGFQEISLITKQVLFDWNPYEHGIHLNESVDSRFGSAKSEDDWDYLHVNSIDKNSEGDYLVSGRHTSTVYKVSGKDGSIIWRLGGVSSNFQMDEDVKFNWQHDARWQSSNDTHAVLSLFDNSGEDMNRNDKIKDEPSTAKVISLDLSSNPMTAKIIRRIQRPDGQTSRKLGNVQVLGEDALASNILVNWADMAYISEHNSQNELVLEAKFQTERMSTYRSFKAPFIGQPTEPPTLKILPMTFDDALGTAFYTSWNGATEIAFWEFYGSDSISNSFTFLGRSMKLDFETTWLHPGIVKYAYAEALDSSANVLSRSPVERLVSETTDKFETFPFDSTISGRLVQQSRPATKPFFALGASGKDRTFLGIIFATAVYILAAIGSLAMIKACISVAKSKASGYAPVNQEIPLGDIDEQSSS